jgi:peptide/nickel transport system permease protein
VPLSPVTAVPGGVATDRVPGVESIDELEGPSDLFDGPFDERSDR